MPDNYIMSASFYYVVTRTRSFPACCCQERPFVFHLRASKTSHVPLRGFSPCNFTELTATTADFLTLRSALVARMVTTGPAQSPKTSPAKPFKAAIINFPLPRELRDEIYGYLLDADRVEEDVSSQQVRSVFVPIAEAMCCNFVRVC